MGRVTLRNGFDTLLRVNDFGDASLLLQETDARSNFTLGQMFDSFQQFRVFLAHYLVKLRGVHPRLYKLLEGLSGIDALVLASIQGISPLRVPSLSS